ncbi:putative membrane protein YdbT with pleckstrin-like domain [Arcanobacterium wilhelmae]|uniref:Membrane protein YdbT with pleckstrin-like domain n=1 Tax=Arcanobacterium wilhelmae TaxID=1803177 RepID=A0ABT9NDA4_9ACTO|nr:PH domain-containing protein [Arcanobacterium wilhelmae]MDP9801701.1 putative membrane protein YdbT with pleckstrin-like domain [Arcanobacterium wilhelmae]WFN91021.1 PH domain-containing protein [Arcanobacterium wilhelmae]
MAFPNKLLGRDERVIRHMHEHIKALTGNFAVGIVVIALVIIALVYLPDSLWPWGALAAGITALVLLVIFVGYPFLQWLTTTYTITDRRVITRAGILTKAGHDIPLSRISNVSYERDFVDRLFGCGTLVLETSAGNPLFLTDVPEVEKVNLELTELLFGNASAAADVDPDD